MVLVLDRTILETSDTSNELELEVRMTLTELAHLTPSFIYIYGSTKFSADFLHNLLGFNPNLQN